MASLIQKATIVLHADIWPQTQRLCHQNVLFISAGGHEEHQWGSGGTAMIEPAEPVEVIGQVMRGDAMEAGDPVFHAAMIGIDVLDVKDFLKHPLPKSIMDDPVRNVELVAASAVDRQTVSAQNGVRGQAWLEDGFELACIEDGHDEICGSAGTVSGHQDVDLFLAASSLTGLPTAGRALEVSGAFFGAEKKEFRPPR